MELNRKWRFAASSAAVALLVASCSDSNGPTDPGSPAGPLGSHVTTQPFMWSGSPGTPTVQILTANQAYTGGVLGDGCWVTSYNPGTSVGTGQINPFLGIQRSGQQHGFNTDASPLPLDATRQNFTDPLPLNIVPTMEDETGLCTDGPYREFILDANEANNVPNAHFSIDAFDMYLCDESGADPRTFTAAQLQAAINSGQCVEVYSIAEPIGASDALTQGSGNIIDYRILVPADAFDAAHPGANDACFYDDNEANPCGYWVVLYSHMGGLGGEWVTGSTFEEFSTIKREVVLPAQIRVAKACVGSQAGEDFGYTIGGLGSGTFTRDCGETAVAVGPTTDFGSYTIDEDDLPAGWTFTSLVCSKGTVGAGASGNSKATIELIAGDDVLCTYTNTLNASSLDIEKQTVGGTGSFDYTVLGDGFAGFSRSTAVNNPSQNNPFEFTGSDATGDKYVKETVPAGWSLTGIACSASGGASYVIGQSDPVGVGFVNGGSDGFDAGDNTVKASLVNGGSVSCTFTNTLDASSLDIEKETIGGTGSFDYTVLGDGFAGFSRSTAVNNPSQNNPFEFTGVNATGDKYVKETIPAGWTLTGISCSALGGASYVIGQSDPVGVGFVNGGSDGFDAGDNTVKASLVNGGSVSCTFTNTKTPRVRLIKEFDPSTDPGLVEFDINGDTFDNTGAGYGHGGSTGFVEVDIGSVDVSEAGFGATDLTNYTSVLSCEYADASAVTVNPNTGTAGTFSIAAGEDITCTFVNTPIPTAEWCSPGFWRNNWENWNAAAWPSVAATYAATTYASIADPLLPGYPKPDLASGDPNTVTVLDILQNPQTYGGPAFNYVGTFLSLEKGLDVQLDEFGDPIHNCTLNQQGETIEPEA